MPGPRSPTIFGRNALRPGLLPPGYANLILRRPVPEWKAAGLPVQTAGLDRLRSTKSLVTSLDETRRERLPKTRRVVSAIPALLSHKKTPPKRGRVGKNRLPAPYMTASLRSFDARKAIFLLALILMASPVAYCRGIVAKARARRLENPFCGARTRVGSTSNDRLCLAVTVVARSGGGGRGIVKNSCCCFLFSQPSCTRARVMGYYS